MSPVSAQPRLNSESSLRDRLASAFDGADRLDVAVAYVKRTGVAALCSVGLPGTSRFVVGTGFALTDPDAVEELDALGASVRVVIGSEGASASAFHPKLYVVDRGFEVVVFSGSGNLTGGGLETNVEQYEELRLAAGSSYAVAHASRFAALWSLGVDLSTARAIGIWDEYKAWAAAARERQRSDASEERRVASRMRARLQRHRGDSLGGSRGDRAAVADRLHAVLEKATGIAPEARRRAYVMLDEAIGTTTLQRAGLELWGDSLVLAVWPGELKDQARALYSTGRAAGLLDFVASSDDVEVAASPHLAFRLSDRRQRVYLTPTIDVTEYVRSWADENLDRVAYPPSSLHDELWPWLLERGYASPADAEELPRFERALGRRAIHLRPGLRVWRRWPLEAAEDLDERGALIDQVRTTLTRVLAALGEPALPT